MSGIDLTTGRHDLRIWLDTHGVSQSELASRAGSTPGTISKILKGMTRPGLGLGLLIEQATFFVSPGDNALVAPVRAFSWFKLGELERSQTLEEIRQSILQRQAEQTRATVLASLMMEVDALETRRSDLENAVAFASEPAQRQAELGKLKEVNKELEIYARLIERFT
jgi:transcriptional regulator with XRE-family HTH domain